MRLHILESGGSYTTRVVKGPIGNPKAAAKALRHFLKGEKKEYFVVFLLNARHMAFRAQVVSIGTLSASLVHPREVFAPAMTRRAAAIIAGHTHPSGNPEPSPDDIEITKRLRQVGELVGIELLDHVIVVPRSYYSMREQGVF